MFARFVNDQISCKLNCFCWFSICCRWPGFFLQKKFAIDFLAMFCVVFLIGFLLLFSMPTFPRYSKFQHWPKSLGGKPPLISWLSLKQHLYVRPNCEELPADHFYWYWTCTCTCHLYLYLGASIVKSCQLTSSNQQPVLPGWQDRRSQRVAEGLRGEEGGNVLRRGLACPAEGWGEGSGISRLLAARFFAGKQSGI